MRKIPTLYLRDPNTWRVIDAVTPGCEWVLAGEGIPRQKYDGTCVMLDDNGEWWARREVKPGKTPPPNYRPIEFDPITGKTVGWEPIEQSGFHKPFIEAVEVLVGFGQIMGLPLPEGTYELIGSKINGNPEMLSGHRLIRHSTAPIIRIDSYTFDALRECLLVLAEMGIEGIVWHHPDGRMAKLKGRDFT